MRHLTIALTIILFGSVVLAGEKADPFVGAWKVTITPDADAERAGEKIYDDVLTFKNSRFSSQACAAHGFRPAGYEISTRGVAIVATFTSNPASDKEGKAEWTGDAAGNEINGKFAWTKPGGSVLRFTFKGQKQVANQ